MRSYRDAQTGKEISLQTRSGLYGTPELYAEVFNKVIEVVEPEPEPLCSECFTNPATDDFGMCQPCEDARNTASINKDIELFPMQSVVK